MSQLHRKPLVELISPIASQNEIQIGNRPKIHALLVFLVKLDKIKKSAKLLRIGPTRRKVAYRHTPHGIHHLQHHHLEASEVPGL